MNRKPIRNAIQEVIDTKQYKKKEKLKAQSFPPVVDLYVKYQSLFDIETQAALSARIDTLVFQYVEAIDPDNNKYERKMSEVKSFGYRCPLDQVEEASKKIIEALNNMAANKWINASLRQLEMIPFKAINDPLFPEEALVYSYVAVKSEHVADVLAAHGDISFREGGFMPEFKAETTGNQKE